VYGSGRFMATPEGDQKVSTPTAGVAWRRKFIPDDQTLRASRPNAAHCARERGVLGSLPHPASSFSVRLRSGWSGAGGPPSCHIAARGIKPHLVETFKLRTTPGFEEKLVDVVGLYLQPPDKAVVLSVDEKSQIQALDRTQASLPMKRRTGREQ
jgi:hypothetical protein